MKMKASRFLCLFFMLILILPAKEKEENRGKPWIDIGLISAANLTYVLVIPSVRKGMFNDYSWERVSENFRHPVRRAVEGGREDHDNFWINCVGHPVSFMSLALWLKARGYSNTWALVFTQAENILWEYVIEGGLWKPSGKDLINDFLGSLAGIYLFHPLSDLGERKLNAGDRRWGNYLLYWLNPFKAVNRWIFGKRSSSLGLFLSPARGGACFSLIWIR